MGDRHLARGRGGGIGVLGCSGGRWEVFGGAKGVGERWKGKAIRGQGRMKGVGDGEGVAWHMPCTEHVQSTIARYSAGTPPNRRIFIKQAPAKVSIQSTACHVTASRVWSN